MNKTDDLPELTEEGAEDYVGECYKIKGTKVEVHKKNCKHKSNIGWHTTNEIPILDTTLDNIHRISMPYDSFVHWYQHNSMLVHVINQTIRLNENGQTIVIIDYINN